MLTNKQAIEYIDSILSNYNVPKEVDRHYPDYRLCEVWLSRYDVEALKMAIKALEQEPCEDCISREELIQHGRFGVDMYGKPIFYINSEMLSRLPSVQSTLNTIVIPKNATNRMALKTLYPDVSEYFFEGYIQEWLDSPYTTEG